MASSWRQWQPTPVLLPGKSHGWRSLVGCSTWGHQESDTTEWLHFHFSLSCIGEGNGNPLQCSCSCLENPRDRGAWWAAVYGVAQSQTRLKQLSSSSSLKPWPWFSEYSTFPTDLMPFYQSVLYNFVLQVPFFTFLHWGFLPSICLVPALIPTINHLVITSKSTFWSNLPCMPGATILQLPINIITWMFHCHRKPD